VLSKANDNGARHAHDCTRETGIHTSAEISEINALRVRVRPRNPLAAWPLRLRPRRVRHRRVSRWCGSQLAQPYFSTPTSRCVVVGWHGIT